jgi:putative chitinase
MLDYIKYLNVLAGTRANSPNVVSVAVALDHFGHDLGVHMPHRFAQYAAQLAHESGGFKYDAEVWGPTPAQAKYDTRTDLGNTPEKDGDGYLYRGRTGIQITGKSNYKQFYDWCKKKGFNPPDFVKNPDLVNTDPWEGLAPLWYWDTRNLNKFADEGNNEMISRRINGGVNGLADRYARYRKVALAILGYSDTIQGLKEFQAISKANGTYTGAIDGLDGPKTRSALHMALVRYGGVPKDEVHAAPVVEVEPVAPAGADKTGVTRTFGLVGILSPLLTFITDIPPVFKVALVLVSIVAVIVLIWKQELIAARVRSAIKAYGLE